MEYIRTFNSVVDEFVILPADQYYRIGTGREDWVIAVDVLRRIYSKGPDNRESLTAIAIYALVRPQFR